MAAALLAHPTQAAPVCVFGMIPCFLDCHHPPEIKDAEQAIPWLRTQPYDKLTWLDQFSALVTTLFGKCLGVNGWKKYHLRPSVVGIVQQAATSWDGLRTVDILLEDFDGHPGTQLCNCRSYIRAEIIRRVWKHLPRNQKLIAGDCVRITGELHWDGHGFLEIHPSRDRDVEIMCSPTTSANSPDPLNAAPILRRIS